MLACGSFARVPSISEIPDERLLRFHKVIGSSFYISKQ